jgi:TolA-binding protein
VGIAGSPPADRTPASQLAQPVPSDGPPPRAADYQVIARQQLELKLYDQALEGLGKVAQGPDRQKAIDASLLMASVHDTRGDTANAMSSYIEIANRFPADPRAAEALTRLAESMLKSKRSDREQEAHRTLSDLVKKYPRSPWAPRALLIRGDLEARLGTRQRDEILGSIPTAAITYREIVQRYGSSDVAAAAMNKLAGIYADTKRFDIAAAMFEKLAAKDANDRYDAWFAAGEIYDKRLKNDTRAKAAYSRVRPSSPRYAEAQKRITR